MSGKLIEGFSLVPKEYAIAGHDLLSEVSEEKRIGLVAMYLATAAEVGDAQLNKKLSESIESFEQRVVKIAVEAINFQLIDLRDISEVTFKWRADSAPFDREWKKELQKKSNDPNDLADALLEMYRNNTYVHPRTIREALELCL